MIVYLDESGDLGWKFDAPYMRGGSSRYLTISLLIIPKQKKHIPKRIVKKLYKKLNWPPGGELKATDIKNKEHREWLAQKQADLVSNNNDIKLAAITVKKQNVQQHLREDPEKLYNYMTRLALADEVAAYPAVDFVPDARTVKVASGNSLVDYLQTHLWYERNAQTKITSLPQQSDKNLNLQFIDYLTNFIWRKYEFNDSRPHNIVNRFINKRELFF